MSDAVFGPGSIPPQQKHPAPAVSFNDVEEYVQVQDEINRLKEIATIAQNMELAQLHEGRIKGKPLTFNFQTIPPTGDAENQTNIGIFNAFQRYIAIEIPSLVKRISILKEDNPALAKELDPHLAELENITKSFPNLTEEQAASINQLIDRLHTLTSQASREARAAFWEETSNMHQDIYMKNEEFINDNDVKISQMQQRGEMGAGLKGARGTGDALGATRGSSQSAAAASHAKAAQSGSVQSMFKGALNKFLPMEERYLMGVAAILMFTNLGASIGNSLLTLTTGFNNAATNFDLFHLLPQNTSQMSEEEAKKVEAEINAEKTQAENAVKSSQNAINKIDEEIRNIEGKNLSPQQKQEMITKLKKVRANLEVGLKQVQNLLDVLKTLKVVQPPASPFYQLTGDVNGLSKAENVAVNGDPQSDPPGGLIHIETMISTFQQDYSSQSQTQQMKLQLMMVQMQQIWSAVSTAEQTIGRMYSVVTQGINPR